VLRELEEVDLVVLVIPVPPDALEAARPVVEGVVPALTFASAKGTISPWK